MNLFWLVVIVLILLAVFGAPNLGVWKHSYGWTPSGVVTVLVIVLIVLLLTGRL